MLLSYTEEAASVIKEAFDELQKTSFINEKTGEERQRKKFLERARRNIKNIECSTKIVDAFLQFDIKVDPIDLMNKTNNIMRGQVEQIIASLKLRASALSKENTNEQIESFGQEYALLAAI